MKIAKRVIILLALTLIVGGASVVLAASAESNGAAPPAVAMRQNEEPTPPPPEAPTSTLTIHPVGTAIAKFFDIAYTDVMSVHASGVGFGVIARAYMTAKFSDGQLTPEEVLELFQSGTGWGQIMKEYGVHPGGKGLGAIMRGHKEGKPPSDDAPPSGDAPDPADKSCPGNRCNAPGHDKTGKGPKK
jgi:hypothetical protein